MPVQLNLLSPPATREPDRTEGVTFSVVLHILILCAAIFTAASFSNLKGTTRVLSFDAAWSTVSACVTIGLILIALLLPHSGSTSTRRQAWKIDLLGVPIIAVGMVVAFHRATTDTDVPAADWTIWLTVTSAAMIMLLVLTARTFRSVSSAQEEPENSPRDLDRDYFQAIHRDKRRAIERAETLLNEHPDARESLSRHWEDTVRTASKKAHISNYAAAHARRTSPWRWQIELVSEPEYGLSEA